MAGQYPLAPVLWRTGEIQPAPACGKAKAGPLRLDSILIWILGMNNDRINRVGPIAIKQLKMTHAK